LSIRFNVAGCPTTLEFKLLGRVEGFPRWAPFIPLEQRLPPRTVVSIAAELMPSSLQFLVQLVQQDV
jgi:hypothetical protein